MDLRPLMKPRSIAVIGASERMNRATRVIANLAHFGYAGRVYPINPKYSEILGLRCYPDLASTPEPADTVVVAIPAEQVPDVLAGAVKSGVRGAVVLSSGFAEAGPAGRQRQAALERLTAEHGLLICGPNCYGVFDIRRGSATFSADLKETRAGAVALVSQSGGFSHAMAEHLMQQRAVGLSYIVSCGNQAGVTVEDYLGFLVDDEDTHVIGAFVEGFRKPETLRTVAARARTMGKAIVALKVGRSENAREAMLAHTGSLAGTADIIDATFRQSGIVSVSDLNEMLDTLTLMAAARAHQGGWRVAVLSGLGGECGRVADVAERVGVELPPLSASSVQALATFMPDFATPRNPLDGTGAMYENPELFPRLMETMLGDEATDVLAVNMRASVPRPGAWAPSRGFARTIHDTLATRPHRLVLCFNSFSGGDLDQEVVVPLADVGVPFLESTETAMLALRNVREHRRFLARPIPAEPADPPSRRPAPLLTGRHGVLDNAEAMALLREFGIPLAETIGAADADAAARAADRVGYPVVLKIDSPDILHKTDVGGVLVGCSDAAAVREAFRDVVDGVRGRVPGARIDGVLVQPMVSGGTEMIVGVKTDPLFGPAVVCGFGGIFVETLRDVAVRVPPLDHDEAHAMIAELRGRALLGGVRGRPPADVPALADVLVRVAALAHAERQRLAALDINPLLVLEHGRGVMAVDWLVELA